MKYLIFFCIFLASTAKSQVVNKTDSNRVQLQDSLVIDSGKKDSLKIFKPTIQDYQYQTQFSERKILDTVLTAQKTFIFSQYNNRDNFGKVPFANVGAGFNPLVYELNPESMLALLPQNKSYLIQRIADVKYYDVKTPTTTFIYHSGVKNGANLQTTYTQNIGKNFNFAIEYLGLRSLGHYRNSLAANNSVLVSAHFISKNNKYEAFAHFLHQNINNEENGGIENLDAFLSDDNASSNRSNLQVNLQNSDSRFSYRRFYFSHQFTPFKSEKFPFRVRHTIFNQSNKFNYSQESPELYYIGTDANALINYPLTASKFSKNLSNTVSLVLDNATVKLDAGLRHQIIKLGVAEPLSFTNNQISAEETENRLGAVGNLGIFLWNKVDLKSHLEFSRGNIFGTAVKSYNEIKIEPIKDYFVKAKVNFQSAAPSFNYLLNTSVYKKFNYHFTDYLNENQTEIGGSLQLKWFKTELFANYFRLDHFTYFNSEAQPEQSDSSVNIAQFGGDATFNYKKFALNTRILFQNTLTNKALFPAPDVIARVNLFYQSKAFKNAAEIQTGIKASYFSKFESRNFFPVLNEFILPGNNPFTIGGQPIVDAYFNLKVKRMFFFIEGSHLNTLVFKNNTFTAPLYPYQDFRLNIGIVWYLIN